MDKICGIYKITNPSGKIYIGQSHDIKKRWRSYKSIKKGQPLLYNSFKKHSLRNHAFEILNVCIDDQKLLNKLEIFWINYYNSTDSNVGLNCREGGSNGKLSKEARSKISKSRIGKFIGKDNPFYNKVHSEETKNKIIESNKRRGDGRHLNNKRSRPILQFSIDEIFIKEFPSGKEIERQTGFSRANILKACKGVYKQCYNYKWKYK